MRPEARLMAGYYPCPPEALSKLIAHLESPEVGSHVALLDPCAGEGKAIQHIARKLQVPDHRVWMVELDPARGDACRKTMPGATVLAPASFLQTSIRGSCFSLIYCNPPFDDHSAKGTRVEEMFLRQAVELVANGGLLAFVCPEYVTERPEFRRQLALWCEKVAVLPWPNSVRRHGEVFVLAVRSEFRPERDWRGLLAKDHGPFVLPEAKGPGSKFAKTDFTDDELLDLLDASPLAAQVRVMPEQSLPSPPLALGLGHLALLLASGQLDGLVCPPGESPHVVRGVATKATEITDETVEETKSSIRTTTVYTERIKLKIRAAWPDGVITTLE